MNLFSDYEKKLVIPRWLSHAKALNSKELAIPRASTFTINSFTKRQLETDYAEFTSAPTLQKASELMSAGAILGDARLSKEAAECVMRFKDANTAVSSFAKHIMAGPTNQPDDENVRRSIANRKQFLSDHPRNAYAWIEQARWYTVLGQLESARRCVLVALNLAPTDRHVTRSAVRFFIHSGDLEPAWHYVQIAASLVTDPWIKATEISVAELLGKHVRKLKQFIPRDPPIQSIFHFSELIESIGMLELLNGKDVQAKRHFKLAWKNPTANVVAHAEWLLRNRFSGLVAETRIDFSRSIEAKTLQDYHALKISDALLSTTQWALEEPYSKRPFALGTCLACHVGKYDLAERLARAGLQSNPHEFVLINNLCFSLLKAGKPAEAAKVFDGIPLPVAKPDQIVFLATSGLLEFKNGNVMRGRELYQQAIACATGENDVRLAAKASIFLAVAETEARTPEAEGLREQALLISEKLQAPDILLARSELKIMQKAAGAKPDSK